MKMMRALAGIALFAACGQAAATGPAPAKPLQPQPPQPQTVQVEGSREQAPVELTAQEFCDRYAKLSQCEWYAKIGMDRDSCLKTFTSGEPQAKQALQLFGPCVRDHTDCGEVATCFAATGPSSDDLRGCNEDKPEHAVGMPRADWEHRKGAGTSKYSDVETTKDAPVEVCGVPAGENDWLAQMTCNDGSHPIGDPHQAEATRVGNVGAGGRCHSIIDLYRVQCPEKTYDVYIDGYVCPQ